MWFYGAWMTTFSGSPYLVIFQCFECYTTLIVKELLYNKKLNFLLLLQKYRNLHNYSCNQHIK